MVELQVKHIKTYIYEESEECFKVYLVLALSNGQFDVDTFEVVLFPEGWWCEDEATISKRFNDYFSASKYIESLSSDLIESDIYDPAEAVETIVEESYRQTWDLKLLQ